MFDRCKEHTGRMKFKCRVECKNLSMKDGKKKSAPPFTSERPYVNENIYMKKCPFTCYF